MLSTLYSRLSGLFGSRVLSEGSKLPAFELEDHEGRVVNSEQIEDALIYFYPKANTPGCTEEACSFRDSIERLEAEGLEVYGVSTDSSETQRRFHDEYDLNFPLLADPDGEVAEKFGVLKPTGFAERTTFIVRDGRVEKIFRKVSPAEHIDEVLDYLQ